MELVPAVGVCLWGQVGTTPLRVGCGVPKGWHKAERGTAADGTTSCPHPSFVKPTPWGHSLASLPAPLAGLVAVGRILEAHTWENPSVGRTGGMGRHIPALPAPLAPGGCRRKEASAGMAQHSTAWHCMAQYGTAWHGTAWHTMARRSTAPSGQAPAGSARREASTELCFPSQLKEKERNKDQNKTLWSDAEGWWERGGQRGVPLPPHPAPKQPLEEGDTAGLPPPAATVRFQNEPEEQLAAPACWRQRRARQVCFSSGQLSSFTARIKET